MTSRSNSRLTRPTTSTRPTPSSAAPASSTPTHPYPNGKGVTFKESVRACLLVPGQMSGRTLLNEPPKWKDFAVGTKGLIRGHKKIPLIHAEHAGNAPHHVNPDHQYMYEALIAVDIDLSYLVLPLVKQYFIAEHFQLERIPIPGRRPPPPNQKYMLREVVRATVDIVLGKADLGQQHLVKQGSLLHVLSTGESSDKKALSLLENVFYHVAPVVTERQTITYVTNPLPTASFNLTL